MSKMINEVFIYVFIYTGIVTGLGMYILFTYSSWGRLMP